MNKTNMKKLHTTIIIIILQIVVCSIVFFGHAQQSFGQWIEPPYQNTPSIDWEQLKRDAFIEKINEALDDDSDDSKGDESNNLTGEVLTASVSPITTLNKPIVFTPQVGLPGFMSRYAFTSHSTSPIAKLMAELFKYGVQIIVILALIVIIVGGFLWSTAGGNGQKVTEAKQWIFSGLGGLSLALFAYLILRTINIGLVSFKPTSIKTVTGLTLNTKSNQDQVADDRGFLDGIYTETFGNLVNLDSEACCIVYNDNTKLNVLLGHVYMTQGKPNTMHVASIAYSTIEDNFGEVEEYCREYAEGVVKEDSNSEYFTEDEDNLSKRQQNRAEVTILSKDDYLGTKHVIRPFNEWTAKDFEDYVVDLALFIVNDSACWGLDSEPIKEASEGLDSPQYCQDRNDGWACIIKENQRRWWGYCEGGICKRCLGYGQTCSQDYQCPDIRRIIGNSTIISGWQCGSKGAANLGNSSLKNVCNSNYGRCNCQDKKCYSECIQNTTGLNESVIPYICIQ